MIWRVELLTVDVYVFVIRSEWWRRLLYVAFFGLLHQLFAHCLDSDGQANFCLLL